MAALTYRCPYCHTTVEVPEDLEDDAIVCPEPSCRREIQLEPRTAPLIADPGAARDGETEGAAAPAPTPEEEIERLHPAMFRNQPLGFLGLLLALGAGVVGGFWQWSAGNTGFGLVLGGLAGAALLGFLVWWLVVAHTTLVLTTRRLMLRKGILSKATTELRHEDIRNLQVDQSMVDRIFGVGDIAVSSAGQDNIEIQARGFRKPDEIARQIRRLQD